MVNHPNRRRKTAASPTPKHDHDADWSALLAATLHTYRQTRGPLFRTDAVDLNDTYLDNLPGERQIHDCHACRHFLNRFGSLVTISEDGHTASPFWFPDTVPDFYRDAVAAMEKAVLKAKVVSPFLTSEANLGMQKTGAWTHFGVIAKNLHNKRLLSAGQAMAAKREDFGAVARGLDDFPPKVIAEAIRLFEAEQLGRSEKFTGPLHWLADLHAKRAEIKDSRRRANILWLAVATAPDGFCHPRSAVTGTLLEDIAAGMHFHAVKSRFEAKVGPLIYQRPQAPPAAGNLAQAEKVVEALGIAPALERRFARLDEVEAAWRPTAPRPAKPPSSGVFAHLSPKNAAQPVRELDAPATVLTWEKFARTVLPGAEAIDAYIEAGTRNFIALTTAVNADAPVILKWGNPVAWYVYPGGSTPRQWGLGTGWAKVTGIVPLPPMWGDRPQPHLGEGMVFALKGCVDSNTASGNALFPECLIGDLHGVRSTIESYSRRAQLAGREEAGACGLDMRKGMKTIGNRLRVTAGGLRTLYQIDRWD